MMGPWPIRAIAALVFCAMPFAGGWAETPRERGAYLVNALAACAGCHTPKGPTGFGPALSGGTRFGGPGLGVFAPNITPDRTTGIGAWTDRQIAEAVSDGVRPDGSRIGPPMPQMAYRKMSKEDVSAIVAYLRSVPAVSNSVMAGRHGDPGPRSVPLGPLAVRSGDLISQGRYIATALSHCTECHTPMPLSAPGAAAHVDEGGRLFQTPAGVVVATGIRAGDLKRFTDAELAAIVTKGIRPDGRKIIGPMPVASYAGFRRADLDALVAFLRSDQAAAVP